VPEGILMRVRSGVGRTVHEKTPVALAAGNAPAAAIPKQKRRL